MWSIFSFFTLVLVLCEHGNAASVGSVKTDETVVDVMSGKLYALEPLSGMVQYRLNHRHLTVINNSRVHAVRLDLGRPLGTVDMELSQDSVWKKDSQLVIRRGDQVEEVRGAVHHQCFLSGRLTSHVGAATFNRCGRLTGLIHAGAFIYEIEESEDSNLDREMCNLRVTRKRANYQATSNEMLVDDLKGFNAEEENLIHRLVKRQADTPIAEVAVVVDSGFVDYMSREMGKKSPAALTDWVIKKWNLIRSVYGNKKVTGMNFDIELKKVEIWQTNPSYYDRLGSGISTISLLTTFCEHYAPNPFDHVMLYTMRASNHHHTMAFVYGICQSNRKCAVLESTTMDTKRELHAFGHSLGLHHDPFLQPCTDPLHQGGFMGWHTGRFLDCYRRTLLDTLGQPRANCLYQKNVQGPALN